MTADASAAASYAALMRDWVSFHVFAVYMFPELLEGIGDLRKRMQGTSCFNVRMIDEVQVAALRLLVRAENARLRQVGLLG
jgi:hypothetical protein